ncbi:MAG: hypothetical protein EB053_01805 [Chlamydiae bacterium]|nr:hypothetical protein [Chlamydiota bacterium]
MPCIPLLIALAYGCFCAYSLSLQKQLLQDTHLKLARSYFEQKKYEQFMQEYPQTKAFLLNSYMSDFIPLQGVRKELDLIPVNTPWFEKKEKLLKKRAIFKNTSSFKQGPYQWTEQKLEKPLLVDFSDILRFLDKIEGEGYANRHKMGSGELFFTEFSFAKKEIDLGQFYQLQASVAEKRGMV